MATRMKESSGGHGELKSKKIRICEDPERIRKIRPNIDIHLEPHLPDPDSGGRVPRLPDPTEHKLKYQRQCEICAEIALEFFNQSEEAKKVGGYELVKAMGTTPFSCGMEGMWYHANFVAKPVNALDDDDKPIVFFAELKRRIPRPHECIMCCILGPDDYGSRDCGACKKHDPTLRHPKEGFCIGYIGITFPF